MPVFIQLVPVEKVAQLISLSVKKKFHSLSLKTLSLLKGLSLVQT